MPFQILIGDKSANSSPDVAMTSSAASAVAHSTTSNPLRLENVRKNLALQRVACADPPELARPGGSDGRSVVFALGARCCTT